MAIRKLYGATHGTCTRRIATVLHELKVPLELHEVDMMHGEHKSPAFLEKQLYIADDGFILYETRAICRYIAAKYPASGLVPCMSCCLPHTQFYGVPGDKEAADAQLVIIAGKLEGYEAILAKQRYVAGETLTLADLFHLPYAPLAAKTGSDLMTQKLNVARWYNELIARPSWLTYQEGVKTTTAY
ncbi:hypothetical protein DFH09DRAFT_1427619 [Mycena vulgaris]|nr:hypothetical protein DFH09DRAFT_1427619 [Mycena vulgaris]